MTFEKLAINGGEPVRTTPFPPWPFFDDEVISASERPLRSGKVNYWTGEEGRQFEREFAEFVGTRHAVAVANGSVALELALRALGVGPGDEVVVTPRSFLASASSVVMVGAKPVFADVDRDSQNITAETVRPVLTSRTKAILAVHLAGWPCEMDGLMELARERGLFVVEDCAQANGGTYRGKQLGSIGHISAFSFCQDKIFTTGGEGGMVTTNDSALWNFCWSFKDHGKSWEAVYGKEHPPGFRWLHESFGTNWRLTESQSAMGRVLLARTPKWITARRECAEVLRNALSEFFSVRVPEPPEHVGHAYYKFYTFVEPGALSSGWDRDRVVAALCAEGVPVAMGSCSEMYLEKCFPPEMRPPESLPVARELGQTSMMFLVHPTIGSVERADYRTAVHKVMAQATRPHARRADRQPIAGEGRGALASLEG